MPRHGEQRRPGRWPSWVYRSGSEPDPRFTLANERTFLAWIRTALGLVAAAAPMVIGVAVAARVRYRAGHHVLHTGRSLPDGRLAAACVLLTTLVAITAAIYLAAG
ncbi:DUF202 domain-containing protein [Phytohabitans sp. ZYX-F-186]|uniref:DUF202 domain-containing protein n=1 Tax=Phytohabitans maris TaxID=3071409 RepID=A0ABU0ZF75_9ACTN|nr:DUF202 domain-containing protein [Phytohabitans sp. ZYX-F-186]MDQ7905703.1 DUF202 domain-containing protein [Phytohabitans sp. ZYX-F-186]